MNFLLRLPHIIQSTTIKIVSSLYDIVYEANNIQEMQTTIYGVNKKKQIICAVFNIQNGIVKCT